MSDLRPEKRIADFEEAAFGMFIHWGLYSLLGKGEWIQNLHAIPLDKYMQLQQKFTAENWDVKNVVKLAKTTGMKYITLTTRHHEGFSLYDTNGLNAYDVLHAPVGRDLVRDFVDACNEEGIIPMFYHTTLDWYRPDFEDDFDSYLEYLRQSIEILCTNYGKVGGFWFDGNWSKPNSDWKLDALYGTIRKHQPEAIIINNTGLSDQGGLGHPEIDSVTFEQGLPHPIDRTGMNKYIAGEMCLTMNNHWGYGECDFNYKTPAELIKDLCNCRKVGANLLLNIGPNGDGAIAEMISATLHILGNWMNYYGEAIYEGRPCEIFSEKGKDNFSLKGKDNTYYLFIFDLPIVGDSNVTIHNDPVPPSTFMGVKKIVESIEWMDTREVMTFIQDTKTGVLTINTTGFRYGVNHVVRVAKMKLQNNS